jgi:hypothetical protein
MTRSSPFTGFKFQTANSGHTFAISPHILREVCSRTFRPLREGVGTPGAQRTRSLVGRSG